MTPPAALAEPRKAGLGIVAHPEDMEVLRLRCAALRMTNLWVGGMLCVRSG
jgi:hypothetical protein